jgi:hypothetical protein
MKKSGEHQRKANLLPAFSETEWTNTVLSLQIQSANTQLSFKLSEKFHLNGGKIFMLIGLG